MVVNQARWPIHGALSWNGIQQRCFNDLPPGQSHDFVVGLGWHDLTIVPGTEKNRFSAGKNNQINWGRLAMQALTLATPGSGGLRLLAPTTGTNSLWQLGVGPGGQNTGDLKIDASNITLHPVQVTGLYAPDGYTVTISGNEVSGTYDEAENTFRITTVSPLKLHWENRNSHSKGDSTARS
jgi:hypothetical protein